MASADACCASMAYQLCWRARGCHDDHAAPWCGAWPFGLRVEWDIHPLGFLRRTQRLNLALEGGGAHGAFTWGVLDRLLEEEGISIGWVSATSARAGKA